MAKIDVSKFIEQSGIRRARFGGYEPDDVRQAMLALCAEYEQRLNQSEADVRRLTQENTALDQHCQSLSAQNKRLSGQNATLAGSSERYSRQMEDLDTQLSSFRERNHSLNDQIAVLRLKNSDLNKENKQLKDRAEEAEAALRVKGRELDAEKAALDGSRQKRLQDAKNEADRITRLAEEEAEKIRQDGQLEADAVTRVAREQARRQAQNLVDAAAAEANEIQNAHQLRLNNLRSEVEGLESRRDTLLAYLERMGEELLRVKRENQEKAAQEAVPQPAPEVLREDLTEIPAPEAKLDLSKEALADTMDQLRTEQQQELPQEEIQGPGVEETTPLVELPEDGNRVTTRKPAFTLLEDEPAPPRFSPAPAFFEDPTRQTGPALTEVPGAIFSSPIVRQEDEPILDETPPTAAPRAPVMPQLGEDEEEDAEGEDTVQDAAAPEKQNTAARRKALRAVRALRRMQELKGEKK